MAEREWKQNANGVPYQDNWWKTPDGKAVNYPWFMSGQGGATQSEAAALGPRLAEIEDLDQDERATSFKYRNLGLTPEAARPSGDRGWIDDALSIGTGGLIGGPTGEALVGTVDTVGGAGQAALQSVGQTLDKNAEGIANTIGTLGSAAFGPVTAAAYQTMKAAPTGGGGGSWSDAILTGAVTYATAVAGGYLSNYLSGASDAGLTEADIWQEAYDYAIETGATEEAAQTAADTAASSFTAQGAGSSQPLGMGGDEALEAVTQVAAEQGVTLTAEQEAAAVALVKKAGTEAGAGATTGVAGGTGAAAGTWTTGEILQAAALALTAVTTGAAIIGGGDQTTAATTVTTPTGPGTKLMPGGNTMPGGTQPGSGAPGAGGTGTIPPVGGTAPGGGTTTTLPGGAPTTFTPGGVNTLNPDGTAKTAGALTFEDFINDYYGLNAMVKSIKQRGEEDVTAQKGYEKQFLDKLQGLDTSRLADTKSAATPYQKLLSDTVANSASRAGNFKPVNLSFGGNPITSFVPKQNIALDKYTNEAGLQKFGVDSGLIDMGYTAGTNLAGRELGFQSAHPVNEAANSYSAKLQELMKYMNPNTGQTSTTAGTVPGVPWWTQALQGLTTGVNIWDKLNNQRGTTLTAADLAAINAAKGNG